MVLHELPQCLSSVLYNRDFLIRTMTEHSRGSLISWTLRIGSFFWPQPGSQHLSSSSPCDYGSVPMVLPCAKRPCILSRKPKTWSQWDPTSRHGGKAEAYQRLGHHKSILSLCVCMYYVVWMYRGCVLMHIHRLNHIEYLWIQVHTYST